MTDTHNVDKPPTLKMNHWTKLYAYYKKGIK